VIFGTGYMRNLSTPTHEYAWMGNLYVQSMSMHVFARNPTLLDPARALTASMKAYTRIVFRLYAQAERGQAVYNAVIRRRTTLLWMRIVHILHHIDHLVRQALHPCLRIRHSRIYRIIYPNLEDIYHLFLVYLSSRSQCSGSVVRLC
jgi:hypothetical protein